MIMQTRKRHSIGWAVFIGCFLILSLPGKGVTLELPQLKARVNDYADILSPATVQQLEGSLAAFETDQSTQIVVLTIPSLEGDALESFSIRVAEQWKVGHKGVDNGAILLVVRNERKIRIEVGYGLEGSLTDLLSGRIIQNIIVPRFKQGNFDAGVMAGVSAMMDAVRGEFSSADASRRTSGQQNNEGFIVMLLAALFFIGKAFGKHKLLAGGVGGAVASFLGFALLGPKWLLILLLFPVGFVGSLIASSFAATRVGRGTSRRSSGGVWGSGGSFGGGGGFSGGGGGFGGGGASGGW